MYDTRSITPGYLTLHSDYLKTPEITSKSQFVLFCKGIFLKNIYATLLEFTVKQFLFNMNCYLLTPE